MNQFSSDTLWYTPTDQLQHHHHHHHQQQQLKPYPFFYHNHNHNSINNYEDGESEKSSSIGGEAESSTMEKEQMFEKALTPSDVGKLNRLVIPKQHAEKYFPLAAATMAVEGGGGLLLGFEDELGKSWKFRYSYWNSSQSYVLTKGWSRYVKDKKLDAADVVYFERHRFNPDRFFIGWRRHHVNPPPLQPSSTASVWTTAYTNNNNNNQNVMHSQPQPQAYAFQASSQSQSQQHISPFHNYIPHSLNAPPLTPLTGSNQVRQKLKSGNSRRVRLFGVNLECEDDDDDEDDPQVSDASSLVSQQGFGSHLAMGPTSYNYYDYMTSKKN